jgi:transposase
VREGGFALLRANAQHSQAVPGRKPAVRDSEWLADLLRHGRLRASFVPDREQREVREGTRSRLALRRARRREGQRLQQPLAGANIQLGAVASDSLGTSGRQMLAGRVGGRTDPAARADLAKGKLRAKRPALARALVGRFGPQQRFLVARQLRQRDDRDGRIAELSAQIAERLRPGEAAITRLDGIPGLGRVTAEVRVAEIGPDMTRFPTARHRASWAARGPGTHERAGQPTPGKTRTGNRALRTALVEAAQAAGRSRTTSLGAQDHRRMARRGQTPATVAVAHSRLVISDHRLKDGSPCTALGADCFDRRNQDARERRLVSRREALGNTVTVEKVA